ncbi:MAG: hypothetical protein MUO61_03535 [Dehalococcoidia bacterium]|nr:hypothetical protein [Dehalococcoidia bacterium]
MGITHKTVGAELTQAEFEAVDSHEGRFVKNEIINGGFTINQRVYVSAATLAATVYGHDRWKAGAGGGDYSFTQLASPTTITIAANKTLIQVVEDKNVYGGTYVLSWTGTCQARYAINSATPAGAYASSPIIITGQTAGTTMSVEFGNGAASGTLGLVQLELGSVATPFELRPYQQELGLCQRYYLRITNTSGLEWPMAGFFFSTTQGQVYYVFPTTMRIAPTSIEQSGTFVCLIAGGTAAGTLTMSSVSTDGCELVMTGTGYTAGHGLSLRAGTYIGFLGAEL